MIATVVTDGSIKRGHMIIYYRDKRKFDTHRFRKDLKGSLLKENEEASNSYYVFDVVVLRVLNKHAPMKKKFNRANEGHFITKSLRNAMLNRTRLPNKLKEDRTDENTKAFKRQRNLCLKLSCEAK